MRKEDEGRQGGRKRKNVKGKRRRRVFYFTCRETVAFSLLLCEIYAQLLSLLLLVLPLLTKVVFWKESESKRPNVLRQDLYTPHFDPDRPSEILGYAPRYCPPSTITRSRLPQTKTPRVRMLSWGSSGSSVPSLQRGQLYNPARLASAIREGDRCLGKFVFVCFWKFGRVG